MDASLRSLMVIMSLTPSDGNGTRGATRFVSSFGKVKVLPLSSDLTDIRVRVASIMSPAIG